MLPTTAAGRYKAEGRAPPKDPAGEALCAASPFPEGAYDYNYLKQVARKLEGMIPPAIPTVTHWLHIAPFSLSFRRDVSAWVAAAYLMLLCKPSPVSVYVCIAEIMWFSSMQSWHCDYSDAYPLCQQSYQNRKN
jgi:hypothetical protein